MTYNLQEFKEWLEADTTRQDGLSWNSVWPQIKNNVALEKLIQQEDYEGVNFSDSGWRYCRGVVLKWIAETCNAQQWLNSKFPTREDKAKVKQLRIYYLSGTDEEKNPGEYWFFNVRLEGELDLSVLPNLEAFLSNLNAMTSSRESINISKIKVNGCAKLKTLQVTNFNNLVKIEGLEKCLSLVDLRTELCPNLNLVTFLEWWKAKVRELEQGVMSSLPGWEERSDSSEPIDTKIQRKKAELQTAITGGRQSTAPLRKVVELLERIQRLENKVRELETREQNYQQQLNQKTQEITNKQQQITNLQSQVQAKSLSEQQARQQITQLNNQITNLDQEKQALQERMLRERQEAIQEWQQEKSELQNSMAQEKEAKDTFQKSADYLRETLKSTEKSLEEIKKELEEEKGKNKELEKNQATALESHSQELKNRSEAYGVVMERNQELTKKLSLIEQENSQLAQWVSKLESVSGEGDALELLKKELEATQSQIISLQEELNSKKPKSYWWVYVVIALVGVYLVMS